MMSALKHHIFVKTDHWAVTEPGFAELDLVAHAGGRADGEFAHSLNTRQGVRVMGCTPGR